jgi:hypothetical protein
MTPTFEPIPGFYVEHHIPLKWTHRPPPLFPDGPATPRDRELARRMFAALDAPSRAWFAFHYPLFRDLFDLPPGAEADPDYLGSLGDA